MNKLSVLTVAVALLAFIARATAGPSAKQAGQSPVYQLDLTHDGHVAGKVTVNTSNEQLPDYVLIAHGLTPNTEYTFGYTTSEEVYTIGYRTTPKAGALVIKGTFPLDNVKELESAEFWVTETPPGSSYARINGLALDNAGGLFIAKVACYYSTDGGVTWTESSHTDGITDNHSGRAQLDSLGVPDGALVKMHAIVVGGKDRTGSEVYQYSYWNVGVNGSVRYAVYMISGVTWNPELEFYDFGDVANW